MNGLVWGFRALKISGRVYGLMPLQVKAIKVWSIRLLLSSFRSRAWCKGLSKVAFVVRMLW